MSTLAAGAALWLCLAFGVEGVRSGAVPGVVLAVLVLTPLAAHELFSGLGPAAQEIPRLRSSAARVSDVLPRPDPVREPARPGPAARRALRHPGVGTDGPLGAGRPRRAERGGPLAARRAPGRGDRPERVRQDNARHGAAAVPRPVRGDGDARPGRTSPSWTPTPCGPSSACASRTRTSSTRPCARTCDWPGRPPPTTELHDALRRARLGDWADSLPAGLDTPVGEHGAQLSGGQRQRLALARVLLADFPVVILDEPAEHLDEETADALTADLLAATAGRTVLLITHRPVPAHQVDQYSASPAAVWPSSRPPEPGCLPHRPP